MSPNPQTRAEKLMYSTVRLECVDGAGQESFGTGFFFTLRLQDGSTRRFVVTNKHVVEGVVTARLNLHEADAQSAQLAPSGAWFTVEIDNFESRWTDHPNPDIDLCAMPAEVMLNAASQLGKKPFCATFDSETDLAIDAEMSAFDAVEEVQMIGYPDGLWDTVNNFPIFRRGTTASHPAVDYCGKPEILVDMACYPGSSGSPVVILNRTNYKGGGILHPFVLLGVLYAGPTITVGGVVVTPVPTTPAPVVASTTMMHLGQIIKAKEVVELCDFICKQSTPP